MKFYRCPICGNIAIKLHDSGVGMVCCNQEMETLTSNTIEASSEKHIPIITHKEDERVITVGEVEHPMTSDHMIEWVYVETENGGFIHHFDASDKPIVKITSDNIKNIYSYCNLHGLWKRTIKDDQ